MAFTRRIITPLIIPMSLPDENGQQVDREYVIPPVGIDDGWLLTELLGKPQAELNKLKMKQADLFRLAMSGAVWDRMRADGVPLNDAWRAGMAALAHFQILAVDRSPEANDNAVRAAEAIWESGVDPKVLAARMAAEAALRATPPSTRPAAARTTRTSASGTGTRNPSKNPTKKAPRSSGAGSRTPSPGR